jgi:hypothetical protein
MFQGNQYLSTTLVLSWAFSGATCLAQQPSQSAFGPRIYMGGDILTMRWAKPEYVESLVVKDGKILFAGTLADLERLAGANSQRIDLKGKTLCQVLSIRTGILFLRALRLSHGRIDRS